jgi:hypothetical protein
MDHPFGYTLRPANKTVNNSQIFIEISDGATQAI